MAIAAQRVLAARNTRTGAADASGISTTRHRRLPSAFPFSFALLLLVLMLVVPAAAQAGDETAQPVGSKIQTWKRIFTEEFDGPQLDLEKWTTCYWWNQNGCTNLSAKELSWYIPDNVSVENGTLRLVGKPQDVIGWKGRTFNYTSGMVTSGRDYEELPRPPRFEFQYGYVEIRAKVPKGQGLWPALWLLPSSRESRPEIDIMEVLGHATDVLEMHFHYNNQNGKYRQAGSELKTVDLSADFHLYAVEWNRDSIVWYLDGKEAWRYSEKRYIPAEKMYLLLNLAVGGEWPGSPDAQTRFPATFDIDYVRVWQRDEK